MISGAQIKSARLLLGWSQFQLAAQAGVTAKVITAVASAAWNHMMFPPFTPALITEVVVSERLVH